MRRQLYDMQIWMSLRTASAKRSFGPSSISRRKQDLLTCLFIRSKHGVLHDVQTDGTSEVLWRLTTGHSLLVKECSRVTACLQQTLS